MDFTRLNQHMEHFTPKYRPEDCLVRVKMVQQDDWSESLRDRVFRNLMRYVSEQKPQMGMAQWSVNPTTESIFIQFSDNCPDRFNVMRNWVDSYAKRYASPRFTVSDDLIKPGPETLNAKGFPWLD